MHTLHPIPSISTCTCTSEPYVAPTPHTLLPRRTLAVPPTLRPPPPSNHPPPHPTPSHVQALWSFISKLPSGIPPMSTHSLSYTIVSSRPSLRTSPARQRSERASRVRRRELAAQPQPPLCPRRTVRPAQRAVRPRLVRWWRRSCGRMASGRNTALSSYVSSAVAGPSPNTTHVGQQYTIPQQRSGPSGTAGGQAVQRARPSSGRPPHAQNREGGRVSARCVPARRPVRGRSCRLQPRACTVHPRASSRLDLPTAPHEHIQ